ncbi:MAG: TonB-dependent receptor [Siphonobacter sp.]
MQKKYISSPPPRWRGKGFVLVSLLTFAQIPAFAYHTEATHTILPFDRILTGVVKDKQTGERLPGVSVSVKGTGVGTTSDAQGNFKLSIPEKATLIFSYVGYESQEQAVTTATDLSIELESSSKQLNELLVVGYGTQTKKEFTGSASRITTEAIKDFPVQSFDQALSGKATGVSIASPNGVLNNPPVIRIRGVNSISLSSYPLIVVDGIPINTGNISTSTSVPNNPLGDINPSDIESIDVLKDAASTSIYGSRAAAGVLLITTKRGKAGRVKVGYEGWTGITNATRLPKLLNAEQYMTIKNEAVNNSKILSGNASNDDVASALFFPSYNADGSVVNTRWYDYIYQTGVSQNHGINISGGTDKTNYYFSVNYSDQKGFLVDNTFKRKGLRFNIDHTVNSWLKLRGNVSYNSTDNQSQNSGSLPNSTQLIIGAARMALVLPPNVTAYNADGSYSLTSTGYLGIGNNKVTPTYYNPVALYDYSRYTTDNDHLIGSFAATATLLKGLNLSTSYSVDHLRTENVSYLSPSLGSSGYSVGGSATNVSALRDNWDWNTTLAYDNRFAKHHVSGLLGYDIQKFENSSWGAYATVASDPFFENYQGGWTTITASGNSISEKSYISYFGRLSYDFNDRYFITANFRRDGNSALATGHKFGNFGGVSAGWALSEEPFYKNLTLSQTLSNIKLRASWGRVGNGNLNSDYAAQNLYSASLYGSASTWYLSQAGNSNLSWETSDQTNIGADLGLWNNRVQVDLTYFNNDVNGLILDAPQSPSKGIPGSTILQNVGSMYNRGIEVGISGNVIRKGNFSWDVTLNYTHVNNKVTALADGNADIIGYTHTSANSTNVTRVGYSIGSLYGAKTAGVNPENGQRIFINAAGEQVQYSASVASGESNWTYLDGTKASAISASDYYLLGNALPKWYGGFVNNFKYRDFDFTLNFTYAGGNYVMNGTKATLRDQTFYNNYTGVLNRWTTAGQVTDMPRLVYGDQVSYGNSYPISDNVEKGDFLRLQNVLLGYRVPSKTVSKAGLSSIRVYAQVSNAFLLTRYTGTDPESSSNGNSNTTPGIEKNSVGQGRTFTLGLNLGF